MGESFQNWLQTVERHGDGSDDQTDDQNVLRHRLTAIIAHQLPEVPNDMVRSHCFVS